MVIYITKDILGDGNIHYKKYFYDGDIQHKKYLFGY